MSHHHDDPTVTVLTCDEIQPSTDPQDASSPGQFVDLGTYIHDDSGRTALWRAWREYPAVTAPSPVCRWLVELQRAGDLLGLLTLRIDEGHRAAGSTDVIELRGHLSTTSCVTCRRSVPTASVLTNLETEPDPRCPICGGVLKPDVVFPGERLDDLALNRAIAVAQDAHTFIVIGTSLVYPAPELVDVAVNHGARLIVVNDGPTVYDHLAHQIIRGPIEEAVPALVAELIKD